MSNQDFSFMLHQQHECLFHTWQSVDIDALEELLKVCWSISFARTHASRQKLKVKSTWTCWLGIGLHVTFCLDHSSSYFFGSLVTGFSGFGTVESDFSLRPACGKRITVILTILLISPLRDPTHQQQGYELLWNSIDGQWVITTFTWVFW